MPDNPEAPLPEDVAAKPKKPSAGGLLNALRKSLGLGEKKPSAWDLGEPEAPAPVPDYDQLHDPVAVEAPAELASPTELAADTRGSTGAVMNAAQAEVSAPVPVPVPGGEPRDLDASEVEAMYRQDRKAADVARAESYAAPAAELPDWLTPPPQAASDLPDWMRLLAIPVTEGPVPVAPPPTEAPAPVAETEKSPEQLAIEQFEEALLAADESLAKLRGGEALDNIQLLAAKAAAAKANGTIRSLPEHYLRVLLASRRLGENRDYTRMDFQRDMLAAIRAFNQTKKG